MAGPIFEAFERVATEHAGREALWCREEDARLTFGELRARVEAREAELRRFLSDEEPVALAVGNVSAFVEFFLALRKLGHPVISMDGGMEEIAKRQLCRVLGVGHLLHRGAGEEMKGGVSRVRLPDVTALDPPPGTALVKLTSGSTGEPVGVCLSEEGLLAGIDQIGRGQDLRSDDRVLIVIPLSHSYGFDNGVLALAVLGTTLVLEPSFLPQPILKALDEGEVTFFPVVPPLVRSLAGTRWPELPLRRVICAGGLLPVDAARSFHEASGRYVHQFFGSTETGGITFERHPEEPEAEGTVGRPLPGVEVDLGEEGRVRVRSKANTVGRLGRDRVARARDVWTGDLGEWTPEGRLRLVGRTADFLNVGGRKIPAAAVEDALRGRPGVDEAAVIGLEDPVRGDRVVAFLVGAGGELDLSGLPPGFAPREIRWIKELPHTERGKLDRVQLRALARQKA